MQKTFIGPHLRRLRNERQETQAQMAARLGISTSYVNPLEKNERSVSVTVLLKLFEVYGVDWREVVEGEDATLLADLRASLQDPLFDARRPDLAQLRAALVHAPDLTAGFLHLHRAYLAATDRLLTVCGAASEGAEISLAATPEASVQLLPGEPEPLPRARGCGGRLLGRSPFRGRRHLSPSQGPPSRFAWSSCSCRRGGGLAQHAPRV